MLIGTVLGVQRAQHSCWYYCIDKLAASPNLSIHQTLLTLHMCSCMTATLALQLCIQALCLLTYTHAIWVILSFIRKAVPQVNQALNMAINILHDLCNAGLQPVLVHMSKNSEGTFSFNPVSINFLVEVVKTGFAIGMLIIYVSCYNLCLYCAILCWPLWAPINKADHAWHASQFNSTLGHACTQYAKQT